MLSCCLRDLLSTFTDHNPSAEWASRVQNVAARVVDLALLEYKQVCEIEDEVGLGPWDDRALTMQVARHTHARMQEWIHAAEQVMSRIRQLSPPFPDTRKIEELRDALGFAKARVQHTPENQDRAFEQVRLGQFISAKELRDDLNARLRAGRQVPVART